MKPRKLLTFLLLPIFVTACNYQPVVLEKVSSVEIVKIDRDSISVKVGVTLNNPNSYKITLTDPDVNLYVNDNLIGKAVFYNDLVLEKTMNKEYVVPVAAGFDGKYGALLLSSLGGILSGNMVVKGEGTVVGKTGFFRKRVPFEFEEDINQSLSP